MVAPKGLPTAVLGRLTQALSRSIDTQEFKDRVTQLAAQAPSPEQRGSGPLLKLIEQDSVMIAGLVKDVGLISK